MIYLIFNLMLNAYATYIVYPFKDSSNIATILFNINGILAVYYAIRIIDALFI